MHRSRWERAGSWIVPVRPLQCDDCGARSWGPLRSGDGVLPWVTSLLLWVGLGLLTAEWLTANPPASGDSERRRSWVVVPSDPDAQHLQPSDIAVAEDDDPAVAPVEAGAAVDADFEADPDAVAFAQALPPPDAPADAPPLPAETGPASPLVLSTLDVRWTGSQMEVMLSAGTQPSYELREYAAVRGYVIDLPGVWSLPDDLRLERTFTRSNLQRLRVGLHRDHLRLVLTLRNYPSTPPRVERRTDGLRVLIP